MNISLSQLTKVPSIEKLVIHSLDLSLYQASVVIGTEELMVVDDHNRYLRKHSKLELQSLFKNLPIARTVLRQHSAYDEMIGQPVRDGSNHLEVDLGYYGSSEPESKLH